MFANNKMENINIIFTTLEKYMYYVITVVVWILIFKNKNMLVCVFSIISTCTYLLSVLIYVLIDNNSLCML